jgi:hypothetical protein
MAMKISPESFRDSLRESYLELLWRQWRALGVAAHGPESLHPLDLEALILATAMAAEQDLRLWQAALQWLMRYHAWVNGARLKRMAVLFTRPDEWLKRPLVGDADWQQAKAVLDPAVEKNGATENGRRVDRTLLAPRLRKPSLLQLFLRGVFGVNARAELGLYLLMTGEGNSTQIARETHYDQKNVYVILERWAEAGFVGREKLGKQNLYSLKENGIFSWPAETGRKFWRWEPFFRTFGRIFVATQSEPWRSDAYLLSSLFRAQLGGITPFAKTVGMDLPDPQLLPGEALFAPMAAALPGILERF